MNVCPFPRVPDIRRFSCGCLALALAVTVPLTAAGQQSTSLRVYSAKEAEVRAVVDTVKAMGVSVVEIDTTNHQIIVQASAAEHAAVAGVFQALRTPQALPLATPPTGRLPLYAAGAPAEDRWIHDLLRTPCPPLKFADPTPLDKALMALLTDVLAPVTMTDGPPRQLRVIPDYAALTLENIDSLEDVMVTDIDLQDESIESGLEAILEQTNHPELAYQIVFESVLITTKAKVKASRVVCSYDITDLINPAEGITPESITAKVLEETQRCGHSDAQPDATAGLIRFSGNRMVVFDNALCQREVLKLLNQLWYLQAARKTPQRDGDQSDDCEDGQRNDDQSDGNKSDTALKQKAQSDARPSQQSAVSAFARYDQTATEREKWLHDLMDKPCPELDFPGETPLLEIINTIVDSVSANSESHQLVPVIDFAELRQDNIESLEDILVRDIQLRGITLEHALDLIMDQTMEPKLCYLINRESLLITTASAAESYLSTRIHDVGPLLEVNYGLNEAYGTGGPGGLGFGRVSEHPLLGLIKANTYYCYWEDVDGEGGRDSSRGRFDRCAANV